MHSLTFSQSFFKRVFDLIFSIIGVVLCSPLILLGIVLSSFDTKSLGLFYQKRVGYQGRLFYVFKIKTMVPVSGVNTSVTSSSDVRITSIGRVLRKLKIDELPQLFNVLIGDMSFVGPRPDVPGFADKLLGDDRTILSIRPGITGPATLKYKNEEDILASVDNPEDYNRNVIFPDKVKINVDYIINWSMVKDLDYIVRTII